MTLDPTATHLPVLESLYEQRQFKTVLEFGCGLFSTKFFADKGCDVTSIEMQHEEWADRVSKEVEGASVVLCLGPDAWRKLKLKKRYDLIFVDGHGDSRPECMEWAKDHTGLIVAHDTEHPYYCWDRANMSGFAKREYKALTPWTTVWTRHD